MNFLHKLFVSLKVLFYPSNVIATPQTEALLTIESNRKHETNTIERFTENRPSLQRNPTLHSRQEVCTILRTHDSASRNKNILSRLTPELLFHILGYLPASSNAILALTCKDLLQKLGPQYFFLIQQGMCEVWEDNWNIIEFTLPEMERQRFLLLLEKDTPDQVFCFFCQKIHTPLPKYTRHEFRQCARRSRFLDYWYRREDITFPRIYAILQNHRAGFDTAPALASFSRVLTTRETDCTYQTHTEARIVLGDFYLRTQHWIIHPLGQPPRVPKRHYMWCLCNHIHFPHRLDLIKMLEGRPARRDEEMPCPTRTGVQSCDKCLSDFQIDIEQLVPAQSAMVCTVWQNFGTLQVLSDERWKPHFDGWRRSRGINHFPGSIKKAYEGDEIFRFDAAVRQHMIGR